MDGDLIMTNYAITFSGNALLSAGAFLSIQGLPSNSVPFIVAEPVTIKAISGAANGIQIGTSFSILQNGNTILSFGFTNQQFIYQNELSIPLNIMDQLSVQVSGISIASSFLLTLFMSDT